MMTSAVPPDITNRPEWIKADRWFISELKELPDSSIKTVEEDPTKDTAPAER
jgi:hypothetical protein